MGDRESHNVIPRYVVVAGVALLLGLTVLAIAFAVQDYKGRVLAEDLDRIELKVFFIAGTLKIAYDLVLYREFRAIRPPEEAD